MLLRSPGVSGGGLADAVRAAGQAARFVPVLDELVAAVRAEVRAGDLVLFLGAGDITRAAHRFAGELNLRSAMNTPMTNLAAEIGALLGPQSVLRCNEPMSKRTTLRVGGPADVYVEPASEDELARVARFCSDRAIPFFVLGRGSNLLVRDGGIRGVVVEIGRAHV